MKCRYCGAEIRKSEYNDQWFAVDPREIRVYSVVECPTTSGEVYGHQPVREVAEGY